MNIEKKLYPQVDRKEVTLMGEGQKLQETK
jgi:hypothetical protein